MIETQETINTWQDQTFPNATLEGITKHLIEEIDELKDMLLELQSPVRIRNIADIHDTAFEAADVIILIYAWAKKHGIRIHEQFVDIKMGINRGRTWNIQPDGTGRHT